MSTYNSRCLTRKRHCKHIVLASTRTSSHLCLVYSKFVRFYDRKWLCKHITLVKTRTFWRWWYNHNSNTRRRIQMWSQDHWLQAVTRMALYQLRGRHHQSRACLPQQQQPHEETSPLQIKLFSPSQTYSSCCAVRFCLLLMLSNDFGTADPLVRSPRALFFNNINVSYYIDTPGYKERSSSALMWLISFVTWTTRYTELTNMTMSMMRFFRRCKIKA